MQYKALASLLFAALAVAAPADIDLDDWESLQPVMSAVPSSWISSLYSDPKFASSVYNDALHGTYPAWYSSLPSEFRSETIGSSELSGIYSEYTNFLSSFGVPATATASATASGTNTRSVATATAPSSTVTSAASTSTVTSSAGSSSTGSASESASGSASGSASESASGSAGATDTSTGGAPAATGHAALGLAGAAGVLGLALAL